MIWSFGERAFDGKPAACADSRNLLQAAIVGGLLQVFERIGIEFVVNPGSKLWPDVRNGLE